MTTVGGELQKGHFEDSRPLVLSMKAGLPGERQEGRKRCCWRLEAASRHTTAVQGTKWKVLGIPRGSNCQRAWGLPKGCQGTEQYPSKTKWGRKYRAPAQGNIAQKTKLTPRVLEASH